ncbi:hypothetical protein ACGFIK_18985 [Micromonospora sp. NPDC048871]|uniref:hypothetical protein n=1 Tax=unclassified Micromonospora TaxID=2617518 RepID=UPI002E148E6C|nr:hypothetical protein OIE53_06515 [Micromonospora sp. NBC_01739]
MEWVCVVVVIGALVAGVVAYRNQQDRGDGDPDHAGAPQQGSLPDYLDMPLDARLAAPEWSAPIASAGYDPATADFVRVVGRTMVSSRGFRASDGMPFASPRTGILIVQGGRVGIAFPDGGRVVVVSYDNWRGELNVGNTGILKLVWDDRSQGIVFSAINVETPEGSEFANALVQYIHTV